MSRIPWIFNTQESHPPPWRNNSNMPATWGENTQPRWAMSLRPTTLEVAFLSPHPAACPNCSCPARLHLVLESNRQFSVLIKRGAYPSLLRHFSCFASEGHLVSHRFPEPRELISSGFFTYSHFSSKLLSAGSGRCGSSSSVLSICSHRLQDFTQCHTLKNIHTPVTQILPPARTSSRSWTCISSSPGAFPTWIASRHLP